jgi:uridine kinase
MLFCFDDFDETNVYPDDFYDWYGRGGNLLEFDCPGMGAAVEEAIRAQNSRYIVLDYPFGRDHPRFRERIDLSVFIDTPLDVAMARRILRDGLRDSSVSAEKRIDDLRKDLNHYLCKGRHVYLTTDVHKNASDLIVDGWNTVEAIRDEILGAIHARLQSRNV